MIILFDVPRTLFSLEKMRIRFREAGAEPDLVDLWMANIQDLSMAAALAGKFYPYRDLARSALRQLLDQKNLRVTHPNALLDTLLEIGVSGSALPCLRTLRRDGHRLVALSDCDYDDIELILEQSGLRPEFERVYSTDMVRTCKPHPALFEMVFLTLLAAPYDCCMVSVHGRDILGAQSLGLSSVYISWLEKQWPFPDSPPGFTVSGLRDVPFAIASQIEKPEALKKAA